MPKRVDTIPRLPTFGLLGHLPAMRRDPLAFQRRLTGTSDLLRVRTGTIQGVWVSSPALLQEMLVERAEDYEKSAALTLLLKPIVGDGILASNGSRYRKRRAVVAPAFQAGRIRRYADAIVAQTDRWLDAILTQEQVDVGAEVMRLTLDVVSDTLFHAEVAADAAQVAAAVTAAAEAFSSLLRAPFLIPPTRLTPSGRRLIGAAADLDRIVYRIIRARRKSGEDPGDVLSMLLGVRDADSGEGLSDEELRDEVMTLFLAGHETTANALTWSLQLLSLHPEVAERLTREVDAVLGDRAPVATDCANLPYALCVFKEAMRLYPPAYLIGRRALTQTRLGGHVVPRGQVVFGNIYGVQRRADLFEQPDAFRPERFLDGAEKRWPKGAYLPFSIGPRVCVGNHFALMEAQLVLVRMAQRLTLAGSIDRLAETEPLVTLRPEGAVLMRIRPRAAEGRLSA